MWVWSAARIPQATSRTAVTGVGVSKLVFSLNLIYRFFIIRSEKPSSWATFYGEPSTAVYAKN